MSLKSRLNKLERVLPAPPPPLAWEAVFIDTYAYLFTLADWNGDEKNVLEDVLSYRLRWVGYSKDHPEFNEAQSSFFVRWLRAFSTVLTLVRHDLRLPILQEFQQGQIVPNAPTGRSWFRDWFRYIEWNRVTLQDGLTGESMETVAAAILANKWGPDFGYGDGIAKFCGACRLFYPIRRKSAEASREQYIDAPFYSEASLELLAFCPHCGTPPIRDGRDALLWASVLN